MAITRLGGANAITGTIPTSVAPGQGKVLQVSDMVIISSEQTLATNTYTDLTSATISITPSSSSNKILLIANINAKYHETTTGYGIKFSRNGGNIFTTSHDYAVLSKTAVQRGMTYWNFIDSPSSTSALTYRIQVASHDNNDIRFQNSAQTTFYAMEIEG